MPITHLDAVAISDLTLDYILDQSGTPHLHLLGGKAVYSAVGLWLWGLKVGLAVDAGYDFPEEWLTPLAEKGIDVRGVQFNPAWATTRWAMRYAPDGERIPWNPYRHFLQDPTPPVALETLPDVEGFSPYQMWIAHQVDLSRLPADYQDATGYHFAGREFIQYPEIVQAWTHRGALLTLDADWYTGEPLTPGTSPSVIADALAPLANFTAVLPSEVDVVRMFGPDVDLPWAARRLAEPGPANVAIKLGRRGSLLYESHADRFTHIPIFPTTTVDPTGAGDAYAGGFLAGLLLTGDPGEAALRGTISASFVVEGFGAAHALANAQDEARRRLAWLRKRVG
jgi:ribokinase